MSKLLNLRWENPPIVRIATPDLSCSVLLPQDVLKGLRIVQDIRRARTTKKGPPQQDVLFLDRLRKQILLYRKKYSEPTMEISSIPDVELFQKSKKLYFGAYGTFPPKFVDDRFGTIPVSTKALKFESRLHRIAAAKLLLYVSPMKTLNCGFVEPRWNNTLRLNC